MGSVTDPPLPPTAPRAPALAAAVPFFAMAVVAGADLLAGPQIGFLPLLSLGPALAPVSLGPARTVLTGVVALLLSGLLASYDGPAVAARLHRGRHHHRRDAAGFVASRGRQRKELDTCQCPCRRRRRPAGAAAPGARAHRRRPGGGAVHLRGCGGTHRRRSLRGGRHRQPGTHDRSARAAQGPARGADRRGRPGGLPRIRALRTASDPDHRPDRAQPGAAGSDGNS